jgi:hypothetical protein
MKTKIILYSLLVLSFYKSDAQVLYYQFEPTTYYDPLTVVTPLCSTCNFTTIPAVPGLSNASTPYSIVSSYLNFQLSNGTLATPNNATFAFPVTSGVTVQMLINLDPVYGLQRKSTLFNIETTNSTGLSAYIEYNSIHFITNSSGGKTHDFEIRLGRGGAQSWEYYLNPSRNLNWHLLTFVYSGDNIIPGKAYKKIYIDGLLPGDYAGGTTLLNSSFHVVEEDIGADFTNVDILNDVIRLSISGSAVIDQIKGFYDEFIIYPEIRTAEQIYKDFQDITSNNHYTFGSYTGTLPNSDVSGVADLAEYPVNYFSGNDYSACAQPEEQLRAFPKARIATNNKLLPNVNWAKAIWMAGINSNNSSTPSNVARAVAIQNELAENWNYYYNFTENASTFWNTILPPCTLSTDVNVAYINDINNSTKHYPLAGLLYRAQLNITAHPNSNYSNCTNISSYNGVIDNAKCLIRCPTLEVAVSGFPQCSVPANSLYP